MDSGSDAPQMTPNLADRDPNLAANFQQVSAAEARLSSLSLEDSLNRDDEKRVRINSSLPADFYDAGEEIETEDEEALPLVAGALEGSSEGGIAWRDGHAMDGEASPSPRSSGYAGERGSSGDSSGIMEEVDGGGVPQVDWDREKQPLDEDDASVSWRKRKKHFIVLSHSGKPIYSRYGDEHKLAGFSATLQAIISFVENGGDCLKCIRAGKHQATASSMLEMNILGNTSEHFENMVPQLVPLIVWKKIWMVKMDGKILEIHNSFG